MTKDRLTIRTITARAVDAPIRRPVKTAVGSIHSAPLILIDLETHQGVRGSAYIFAYTALALAPLVRLINDIGQELTGKTVAPFDLMSDLDHRFRLLGWQGLAGMAVSGLDMAFWDALGRAADRPVVEMLGGTARPLRAYDSYGVVDPVSDASDLRHSLAQGFRGIKIKGGDGDLANDLRVVAAVRDIIGSDVALMLDFNQSLDPIEAIRRIECLAAYDLTWIEEPVQADNLQGHAQVRGSSRISIQSGENWWFPRGFAEAIIAGASDFIMPDVMKCGGVTGWTRIAAQAEAASIPVSSHLFPEASAHLLAVTPTAHWLEYLDFAGAILAESMPVTDGMVTARGPGLGMVWNETAVAKYVK